MPAWTCKPHADLTTAELYALLTLRSVVFVMEQNCPYLDMDGQDLQGQTQHLMAWDNGALVAYCRLLEPARNEGRAVIGRVVTAPSARGARACHELVRRAKGGNSPRLARPAHLPERAGAPAALRAHGFKAVTEEYMEDNIPHIGMLLDEPA